jgi:hypothetical protein
MELEKLFRVSEAAAEIRPVGPARFSKGRKFLDLFSPYRRLNVQWL